MPSEGEPWCSLWVLAGASTKIPSEKQRADPTNFCSANVKPEALTSIQECGAGRNRASSTSEDQEAKGGIQVISSLLAGAEPCPISDLDAAFREENQKFQSKCTHWNAEEPLQKIVL